MQALALALALASLDPLPELPPADVARAWADALGQRLTRLREDRHFVHGNEDGWAQGVAGDDAAAVLGAEPARHLRLRYPAEWFDAWEQALDRSAECWRSAANLRQPWAEAWDWGRVRRAEPLAHWRPAARDMTPQ